ncbi:MAG TPA: serine/threonine-protein kinase [Clostridiales bacterium]|nr:serine/threonine-protein kinase [Clostridiales bacterium]
MNDMKIVVNDILNNFDNSAYPAGFLAKYHQLECLANSHGTETFLVKPKDSEHLFVAKCYDKKLYSFVHEGSILKSLHHIGLPAFTDEFQNDTMVCIVREYIEGKPLNQYIMENNPDNKNIINICLQLCNILIYLHGQEKPVIHRDIKPQNIIIKDDGQIVLIDFDISRVYNSEAETDTQFFGTKEYASPEQYGFSQTDCRTDIYSFGVLLRFMLTENEKENPDVHLYKPLEGIVKKCTAFAPKERFNNAAAVKKALLAADPKSQRIRKTLIAVCSVAAIALCVLGSIKWYQYATHNPFAEGTIPAVLTDRERVADAVSYMSDKYDTDLFADTEAYADIGFVKTILTDIYGYDSDYVHAMPEEGAPHESEKNFLPWGIGDEQYVARDVMVYVAVKIYWVDKILDYSSLKDDNGYYPGVRVAVAFAEETGILTGVGRPEDITKGEVAILLANADRVYEATKE